MTPWSTSTDCPASSSAARCMSASATSARRLAVRKPRSAMSNRNGKELLAELEMGGHIDYGKFIPSDVVRDCLDLVYPEVATKREFDQLALTEMAAVDYVRNVLLGCGMYIKGECNWLPHPAHKRKPRASRVLHGERRQEAGPWPQTVEEFATGSWRVSPTSRKPGPR